jgi:hypothetical protein
MTFAELKAKLRGATKSWTIRVNAIIGALLYNSDVIQQYLPQMAPYLPPARYQQLVFTVLMLNMVLRFRTSKPLAEK